MLKVVGIEFKPITVLPKEPFSTDTALIGNLESAINTLKKAIADVHTRWEFAHPIVVFHAIEMKEDKMSEEEQKSIFELGNECGAMRCYFLTEKYHDLSDEEVRQFESARPVS